MRMESLLGPLREQGAGLLITVDEVRVDIGEVVKLGSAYQLFVRNSDLVSLTMRGYLPTLRIWLRTSAFRFCVAHVKHYLGTISDVEIARAFRKTIYQGGKTIAPDALSHAVETARGFPYMMQLVGYHMWSESDTSSEIGMDAALQGATDAKDEFRSGVLDRTWKEMSKGDQAFVRAMVPDDNGSTLTDIAMRMGRGTNYASTYKRRLLRQGVIGERPGSTFDFDTPMMRKYVEEVGG